MPSRAALLPKQLLQIIIRLTSRLRICFQPDRKVEVKLRLVSLVIRCHIDSVLRFRHVP